MPDLNSLGLTEAAAPAFDWDAPPPGTVPPPVTPGRWKLLLRMPENHDDWFASVEREVVKGRPDSKRNFLEVTIVPEVVADSQGRPVAAEDGSPLILGPQRFNTFMSTRMRIHRVGELLRGVGVRIDQNFLAKTESGRYVIDEVMTQLDGKATFDAEIIWRSYFKSTDTTISTHPRGKKSGELLWPKAADGSWELMATNSMTGEKQYGYAEVAAISLPATAAQAEQQTLGTGGAA